MSGNKEKGKNDEEDSEKDKKEGLENDEKGKKKEENMDSKINSSEVNLMKIMVQLENLRDILIRGHTILLGEACYDAKNSITHEIKCNFIEEVKDKMEIIEIGDGKKPYVLMKVEERVDFNNYDEMIKSKWDLFENILKYISEIQYEPERELTYKGEIYKPTKVGIPAKMLNGINVNENVVQDILFYFLRPMNKMNSVYTSKMNIIINKDLSLLKGRFFSLARLGMPILRKKFIEFWKFTLDNNFPKKVPQEISALVMIRPICDPYYLNLMFRDLPLCRTFSFGLVIETLMPEIPLEPIPPTIITGAAGVSVMRASIITPFNAISYDSSWSESLLAYFGSYISPSFIEMNLTMDDIDENSPLYLLCLLTTKLLFMYNENDLDWNNISATSINWIDAKIITSLCDMGIIASIDVRNGNKNPNFEMYAPTNPKGKGIQHWSYIYRSSEGGGWQNDGQMRYGINDYGKREYSFCSLRQKYVNDVDTREEKEDDFYSNKIHNWRIYIVLKEICSAVQSCNPGYNGISTIFSICAKRIFSFYSELNIFLRRRWYTGLRLPEKINRFEKLAEDKRIVQISGRTVLYILKSMHGEKKIDCTVSYDEQFRIESNLTYDVNKFRIGIEHIKREIIALGISEKEYKKTDIYKLVIPESGPLQKHLQLLDGMRLLSYIKSLNYDNRDEGLISLMSEISNYILNHNEDFGIIDQFVYHPEILSLEENEIINIARDSLPWDNRYKEGEIKRSLNLKNIGDLIFARKFFSSMMCSIKEPTEIKIPIPYEIILTESINIDNNVIKVEYKEDFLNNVVRTGLKIKVLKIYIANLSYEKLLNNIDTMISGLNFSGSSWPCESDVNKRFLSITKWLNMSDKYFNIVDVVRTKEMREVSFYDFVDHE